MPFAGWAEVRDGVEFQPACALSSLVGARANKFDKSKIVYKLESSEFAKTWGKPMPANQASSQNCTGKGEERMSENGEWPATASEAPNGADTDGPPTKAERRNGERASCVQAGSSVAETQRELPSATRTIAGGLADGDKSDLDDVPTWNGET